MDLKDSGGSPAGSGPAGCCWPERQGGTGRAESPAGRRSWTGPNQKVTKLLHWLSGTTLVTANHVTPASKQRPSHLGCQMWRLQLCQSLIVVCSCDGSVAQWPVDAQRPVAMTPFCSLEAG
ncbi:hypothetical protein EYF80_057595 [Liparis tanakae]|uniref:Uncharacterized protein n=1 Tax=Liparis tanakae TaxID=230148 RepID=A0A4Z2ETR9_9TELE|nr:hypothetical protein EYF80_057595 [Liparis tanakae]